MQCISKEGYYGTNNLSPILGNSIGLRIFAAVAKSMELKTGDLVNCTINDNAMRVRKASDTVFDMSPEEFEKFARKQYWTRIR